MLTPEELSALALSAKVAGFATAVCLPFAIAVAWLLARYEFRAKFLVEANIADAYGATAGSTGLSSAPAIWSSGYAGAIST